MVPAGRVLYHFGKSDDQGCIIAASAYMSSCSIMGGTSINHDLGWRGEVISPPSIKKGHQRYSGRCEVNSCHCH